MGEFPQGYQYGREVPVVIENAAVAGAAPQSAVVAETAQVIGQQQKQIGQGIDELTLQYEQTIAQDALNRLRTFKDDLTYGEKNGFMNLKGEQVMQKTGDGLSPMQAYTDRMAAASTEASKGLIGRARQMYEKKAPEEIQAYQRMMLGHTIQQADVFNKNVFAGTMKQAETESVRFANDPEALGALADRVGIAAKNFARTQGLPAEPLIAEMQSNIYKNAITSRIIAGDSSALVLFEQYKDKLDGRDRLGLEQSIKTMALGVDATAWVASNGVGTGPTTEGAKAGTKASMAFWQSPDAKGDKFSAPVAAGITAGFLRESQFFSGARNKGDGRDGSDSINIGQWNSARAAAFKAYAAKNGLDPNDVQTGLKYAKAEIDGEIPYSVSGLSPDFKAKLMAAKTEKEAADIMTRGYFRPKYQDGESNIRQQSAAAILRDYGGAAPPGVEQGGGEQVPMGDPLAAAVNKQTALPEVPQAGTRAASSDGILDTRRMMIDAERQRIDLLQKAAAQFSNNLPMLQNVTAKINTQFELRKSQVQLYKDEIYAGVQDWMTKGGPNGGPAITPPPANIFSQLTWEQQQSIERQVARNVAGKKTVTDFNTWYTIQRGLTSDNANERNVWANTNLTELAEFLSPEDRQELAKLQAAARKGDGKELTQVQTRNAMNDAAVRGMGINPNPKAGPNQKEFDSDTQKAARFYRVLQDVTTEFESAKGKDATPQEYQSLIDGVVRQVATGGKSWWGKPTEKPLIDLVKEDVPPDVYASLTNYLRGKGVAPTPERVLHLYKVRKAQEPTQTEIPRVMPAFNPGGTLMDTETRMYGGGLAAPPPPRPARGTGVVPASPRVIDNPPPGVWSSDDGRTVRQRYRDAMDVPPRDLSTITADGLRRLLGL